MKIKLDEGAKPNDWYNVECLNCGTKFHLKPYALKRNKTHYCSKQCHNIAKREYMKGEKNHQYGLKGALNASWDGATKKLTSYGYIMTRMAEHPFADHLGWVFEHRVVAEKHLLTEENSIEINGKRYLKNGFCVHHKNFDRTDNRPENLVIMTQAEHRNFHNALNPHERNEKGQYIGYEAEKIKVKRTTETAIVPKRQSIGAAGYDLHIDSVDAISIPPHSTVMVLSGIAFEIPKGYFGAVYARSGISTKEGVRPATCVSVIDSDYRGSVGLPLHNDTDIEKVIKPYERVAQIVFQKALTPTLEIVDSLEDTERGENGFGSSGK